LNTKQIIALSAFLATLAGCASQSTVRPESAAAPSNLGACATNFTTEGSFWTGTRYSTFEEFPKKTVSGAFDALLQSVASSGYQVNSSSKEAGMISASQTVTFGQGKTVPLNFVIKKFQTGVRVDVSFSTSGGVTGSADGAQKEFCKLLASVGHGANEASPPAKVADDNTSVPKKKAKKPAAQ
jgi:hypothetical protein